MILFCAHSDKMQKKKKKSLSVINVCSTKRQSDTVPSEGRVWKREKILTQDCDHR